MWAPALLLMMLMMLMMPPHLMPLKRRAKLIVLQSLSTRYVSFFSQFLLIVLCVIDIRLSSLTVHNALAPTVLLS